MLRVAYSNYWNALIERTQSGITGTNLWSNGMERKAARWAYLKLSCESLMSDTLCNMTIQGNGQG